jgi:glycosyltransferase involved in cell wall biosynthesis
VPKVSVIIPSYNTATLIGDALDSVLAQTYRDFEIITVNDGSPDTPELERVLERYRERIVYLKQENRRACGARNNAIRHAGGEYLAFLDSDDSWMPTYLEEQIRRLDADSSLDMIYCDCLIEADGLQAGKTHMQMCPSQGPVTFESLLLEKCQPPISGTVVRRQALINAGLFDESLKMCDDFEMWLRLAYHGARISFHSGVLGRIRIGRADSLSASNERMLAALVTILSTVQANWKLTVEQQILLSGKLKQTQALLALERGKECLRQRDFEQARTLLEQANNQLHRRKISLAVLGLRILPKLTALAIRRWERLQCDLPSRFTAQALPHQTRVPGQNF